jgi:hypothetical protein
MGWRGTLRSIAAAARAAEREAERRQKQTARNQMTASAAGDVAIWEQRIEMLSRVHTDSITPIDWHEIANEPKPAEPMQQTVHHDAAVHAFNSFRPNFFDIFQGGSEKKLKKLQDAIIHASVADAAEYEEAKAQYTKDISEWETDTSLARRILDGEPEAYKKATEEFLPLSKDALIGSAIAISFTGEYVHARPTVHSTEIVPSFRRKQLASGRLSETKMPTAQFNGLYQDYVAGVAFKVADDFFRVLPLDQLYVTCLAKMLNAQTGHQEIMPILSVQFVRETLAQMNLAHVDPSDALSNFNHAMQFKRTVGFSRIKPLKPCD